MKRLALLAAVISAIASADVLLQNQGATQGPVTTINCSGTGVTCTRYGSTGTFTIPHGPSSGSCGANQWETADNDDAPPSCAQVCFGNLCGTATDGQLGSAYSGVGSCGANNWVTALTRNAAPTCVQPGFSNLSGTATDSQLASAYSGTGACGANTWASTLSRNAAPTCTQPGFSNLSGTATDAQLANAYSGVAACAAHKWTSTLTRNAAPTCTQPDFSDLTGTATDAQLANAYSGVGACAAGKAATTLTRNAAPTCSDTSGIGACAAGKAATTLNGLAAPTCSDVSGIGACAAGKAATTLNGLAAPTCTTVSGTGACAAGQAVTTINALAAPTCTNVSGTGACGAGQAATTLNGLAAPTCTSVSGVGDCGTTQFASAVNGLAAPTCGQVEPRQIDTQTVPFLLPPNGSLEGHVSSTATPDNWTEVTGTFRTDADNITTAANQKDGLYALDFKATAVAAKMRSDFFPVGASVVYRVECWVKKVGTPTNSADLAIEWYDSTQALISTNTNSQALSGFGAGWSLMSTKVTSASTAAYAKVFIAKHDTGTFEFYADAVRVYPEPSDSAFVAVSGAFSINTTSSTFATMTGMSVSFTQDRPSQLIRVNVGISMYATTAATAAAVQVTYNGVAQTVYGLFYNTAAQHQGWSFIWQFTGAATPGTYTVALQWRSNNNVNQFNANADDTGSMLVF